MYAKRCFSNTLQCKIPKSHKADYVNFATNACICVSSQLKEVKEKIEQLLNRAISKTKINDLSACSGTAKAGVQAVWGRQAIFWRVVLFPFRRFFCTWPQKRQQEPYSPNINARDQIGLEKYSPKFHIATLSKNSCSQRYHNGDILCICCFV